ncbi:MAG: hypothetical protein H0T63_09495 [Pyrinomonadaceae bacterium]|nr:hypothetical protein [Pyrinomonadaceae bacterium]MDQ3584866.1 hypothetical protein [Acidobacteriota bacterium]
MRKLHERWGEEVSFVDVLIRQAHPGPRVPPYRSFDQKLRDAMIWQAEDVPYPVAVDDLEGTVHQVYGGLADPSYMIDADGRVAFYNMWTHAPTLHEAIKSLTQQGERGIVNGGIERTPHIAASMTDGWKGLRRGLPQSFTDLELSAPGTASGTWIGYQLKPLLAPLTLRAKPLPLAAKAGLALGAAAVIWLGARRATAERRAARARNSSER